MRRKARPAEMDADHRLLLRCTGALLRSQNSGVVLAAASLYHALAPPSECTPAAKALVHACRAHPEMQYVLLSAINSIAAVRPAAFRPFLKAFFVLHNDPLYVRELKLDIMASLVTDVHMTAVLSEFQAYVRDPDQRFVAAAIQALGRAALNVAEVAPACMRGLLALVAGHAEPQVVGQAVAVLRQLLQRYPALHENFLGAMLRLLDSTKVAEARAAIVWTLGEYRAKARRRPQRPPLSSLLLSYMYV